jgi:hypothetical protein
VSRQLNVYIGVRLAMMNVDEERLMQEVHEIDRHPLDAAKLRGGVLVDGTETCNPRNIVGVLGSTVMILI